MRDSRIALVGMMGAGKSTVGRLLAERLGVPFLDSDEQIETDTGWTVVQLLEAYGIDAMRAEESRVLAQALDAPPPVVLSTGGGTVLDPGNRMLLRKRARVVWLRARLETLTARVGDGETRPLLKGDPKMNLSRLMAERDPFYAELAEVTYDVDDVDAETAAQDIQQALS